jgi:serine/threonine protein kinase
MPQESEKKESLATKATAVAADAPELLATSSTIVSNSTTEEFGEIFQKNLQKGRGRGSVDLPDLEFLKKIGRGSYGSVWLAEAPRGNYQAVKVIYKEHEIRPFQREIEGVKLLQPLSHWHPGLTKISFMILDEGKGYLIYGMELADDLLFGQNIRPQRYIPKTLQNLISLKGALPVSDCIRFGLNLTAALTDLHARNIIHRDVKPSNIVFVDDVPKLADFGLANQGSSFEFIGSEGYVPPEGPGTPAGDIYGLGISLYVAATGRRPLDFPSLPAKFDSLPDRDQLLGLNLVILRACERNQDLRYQSATEMHQELLTLAEAKSIRKSRLRKGAVALATKAVSVPLALFEAVSEMLPVSRKGARSLQQSCSEGNSIIYKPKNRRKDSYGK